jgi:hypothetical protein
MPDQAPGDEAREFAGAFRAFLEWIHIPATAAGNEVSALLRDFLGPGGALTPGPGRAGPMMYARRAKMVRRFGPHGG